MSTPILQVALSVDIYLTLDLFDRREDGVVHCRFRKVVGTWPRGWRRLRLKIARRAACRALLLLLLLARVLEGKCEARKRESAEKKQRNQR